MTVEKMPKFVNTIVINMGDYFIKTIDGPEGQRGYPHDGLVHFANGKENACEQFKKCSGFLIYETFGKKETTGAKTIYAYGTIDPIQPEYVIPKKSADGRSFPYAVKVKLQKRIEPKDGIPFKKVRTITNVKVFLFHGGLIPITKDQFNQLCSELDNRTP